MGPKFAIVFSGVEEEAVGDFMKTIKEKVEALEIETAEDYKGEKTIVSPKINIALARYYKGTALVGVTKRLEEYLDMANPTESNINYLQEVFMVTDETVSFNVEKEKNARKLNKKYKLEWR